MLKIGKEIRFRLTTILATHWKEFVDNHGQWIRPVVFETVRRILACRTPVLGCHYYCCKECGESLVIPHSCKSRFCTTCGKLAADRWAAGVLNDLLDVPYHHLVVSIPKELRSTVKANREVALNLIVRAAIGCLQQWARDQQDMRLGIVAVIHTFGGDLKWHPHIHLLVTEGGLSLDGQRWIQPYNQGWFMSHSGLKSMWRYHCVTAFRKAHREGLFRWPAEIEFLKNYSCFNKMLSNLYQKTWYAHIGACLSDPTATVRYIGRYTKRAVMAEYRITAYDEKIVRFAFRDYAHGGKTSYKTMPVLSFIERLIQHIPDKHFKMVRYAGIFSTRWKAHYLVQAKAALENLRRSSEESSTSRRSPVPSAETPSASGESKISKVCLLPWRERRIAQQGVDPILCKICQEPMSLVGMVFGSHDMITDYFEAAGIPVGPRYPTWHMKPG